MGKEKELKLIADMLTIWQLRIHNRKALDFFDINRTAEDIAMMLLNEIYGLKLENLNKDHPNISAIDLGDEKAIAGQPLGQRARLGAVNRSDHQLVDLPLCVR